MNVDESVGGRMKYSPTQKFNSDEDDVDDDDEETFLIGRNPAFSQTSLH